MMVTLNGETKPLYKWCRELDRTEDKEVIRIRIVSGWPPARAFSQPVGVRRTKSQLEADAQYGDNPGNG